ncbi:MAG: hypothetical protein PUH31_04370, partial [Prevotella stercorea]|uniref:hypothetical protein n=1 Tax=Leyella stercorea TaxID=363265 RepID=UPI0028014EE4|nr:hypothetical protein [Leyella stercorea]MDY5553659.1 hypothetical protein [Prevotella sp.]
QSKKGNSLIIRLLPFLLWQAAKPSPGRMGRVRLLTQGAALGYVLLPLWGVSLASFAPSYNFNRLLFNIAIVL